ncbi:sensor histidine kinase [Rubrivirga sp. IMCC45206]|uniref:sensor histidine kinase n=1 Tax=Rubrivirga sp. IMCC45206 TaxID=3391614 RepID=UPI00398FF771
MTPALCVLLAALLQLAPADSSAVLETGRMGFATEDAPLLHYRLWETPDDDRYLDLWTPDGTTIQVPAVLASQFGRIYDKHYGDEPSTGFGWDIHEGMLLMYIQHTVGIQTAWVYLAVGVLLALAVGAGLWGWRRRRRRRVQRDMHVHQIESREEERGRVSRELHDGPLQDLTMLALTLDGVDGAEAAAAREGIRAVARELRTLAEGLRPPLLDQFGLASALQDLTDRAEAAPTPLDVEVRTDDVSLAPDAELALYRVAQEALTNAVRHGAARRATVALESSGDGVSLTVHDDGRGFGRRPSVDALVRSGHFGLAGMRERVRLVDGTLELSDAPDGGATVVARIPAAHRPAGRERAPAPVAQ